MINHKIKDIMSRSMLFLLTLAVLLPTYALRVSAEEGEGKTVSVVQERFMTDEMAVENAVLSVESDQTVKMTIRADSPAVSMDVVPTQAATKANALRIVIKNESLCNGMKIDYVFKNSAQISESASLEEIYLSPLSQATEYIIYVPEVDTMTKLSIRFVGASEGTVDIVSIGAVSVLYDNRDYFGELSENSYDRKTQKGIFAGSVSYDMLLKHPGAKVVLYRLAQTEVIEDVRFVHPYVASCPMTLNYKFEFKIESTSEYCSRYFAAILTEDNKIIPLTSETYLKEKNGEAGNGGENHLIEVGFKGIETNLYAGAAENGTAVAFVDVVLNRMANESGDGYQYILDEGKEYYFDRAYVQELDEEIKSLSSAGASIYLRFILDSPSPIFGHFKKYVNSDKTKYYAIDPQNDETVDNIFAYTDFICSRYSEMSGGELRGVILGRSLDKALTYNYCGPVSMNNYADMLAKVYSVIRIALDRSGSDLEILLPFSDDEIGTDVIMTGATREDDYPADLLVKSLLGSLKRYGSEVSTLFFVLESDCRPEAFSKNFDAVGDMAADNCDDFINMVKNLSDQYEGLSEKIVFCWFPSVTLSNSELLNIYAYSYNFLACNEEIKSYVVSVFEREELLDINSTVYSAEEHIFSTLKSTYKYADTNNNPRVCAPALEAVGKMSWEELIDGYSDTKTVKRDFLEKNVEYTLPEVVSGSYKMWDYSVANGTGGWSMSDGCTSLSVYTLSEFVPRAMIATLKPGSADSNGADYGSIIYHAPESLLMQDVSTVSFDVLIPQGAYGDIFEIKVTVGAENAVSESSGIVKAGEKTAVYSDISEIDVIKYIKIGIRNLSGASEATVDMCIESISIHSREYSGDELENMVLSGEIIDKEKKEEKNESGEGASAVIAVLAVSIAAVAVLWLLVVVYDKVQKNSNCAQSTK